LLLEAIERPGMLDQDRFDSIEPGLDPNEAAIDAVKSFSNKGLKIDQGRQNICACYTLHRQPVTT
jgi:hypothetical protein